MQNIPEFAKNDKFAEQCGVELMKISPGYARAQMTLTQDHWNGVGIAHGGAIFTLADFAFAMASNSRGRVAVAINVSGSFLKAVSTGVLTAEAKELSRSPKLAVYSMAVTDETGDLVASFQGMVYRKNILHDSNNAT